MSFTLGVVPSERKLSMKITNKKFEENNLTVKIKTNINIKTNFHKYSNSRNEDERDSQLSMKLLLALCHSFPYLFFSFFL